MNLNELPLEVIKERDPALAFSSDITTESGRQSLELWYIFGGKLNLATFCNTLRNTQYDPSAQADGIIAIPITDKVYKTTHNGAKFVTTISHWHLNILNYQETGKWTKDKWITMKIKALGLQRPKNGKEEDILRPNGISYLK